MYLWAYRMTWWAGRDSEDICSELTRVNAAFWANHLDVCEQTIYRDANAYWYAIMYILYLYVVLYIIINVSNFFMSKVLKQLWTVPFSPILKSWPVNSLLPRPHYTSRISDSHAPARISIAAT